MKKCFVLILLLVVTIGSYIYIVRLISYKEIHNYIKKQGIDSEDILIEDFFKNWKDGGYIDCIYVKGENSDIFYEYYYRNHEVTFNAVKSDAKHIEKKIWGGSGLTEEEERYIKYPPLN